LLVSCYIIGIKSGVMEKSTRRERGEKRGDAGEELEVLNIKDIKI